MDLTVLPGAHAGDLAELVQLLGLPAGAAERWQGLHPVARHPQEWLSPCIAEAVTDDPQVGVDASRKGLGQTGEGAETPHPALPGPQERDLPAAGGLTLADDGSGLVDAPGRAACAAQRAQILHPSAGGPQEGMGAPVARLARADDLGEVVEI